MKKIYCLKKFRVAKLICTAFFLICTISNSKAQYAFIPDSSFRNWLNSNGYSGCMNGPLLDTTCSAVITATVVNCNNGTITNLTGIQYFDNLVDLHCSSNPLTFLPNLPSGLLYLEVTNAQLTSLSALPAGLITLNCGNNGITSLPQLPSTLTNLVCDGNQLTLLPSLPSLDSLNCSQNQLSSLPALPSTLTRLWCTYNHISALPPLPLNLVAMACESNWLDSLPDLPLGLTYLNCAHNQITSLPALPSVLTSINCRSNLLSTMPALPSSLVTLECQVNNITSLPTLPSSLNQFHCQYNQLTTLPALPSSLIYFECHHNLLSTLPTLPSSLQSLLCSNNQLTSLPPLPGSLFNLYCNNNLLTEIPDLPVSFGALWISDNPVSCFPKFTSIFQLVWSGTLITCRPFVGNVTSPSPSLSTLPLCEVSSGCPVEWNISGKVYNDLNGNCNQDSGEADVSNIPVALDSGGTFLQNMSTDDAGMYSFRTSLGNYSVRADTTGIPFNVVCPPSFSLVANVSVSDSLVDSLDFGLQCKPGFDLIAKSISPSVWFRPGATRTLYLNAGDNGNFYNTTCANGISGSVQVILGNYLHYVSPAAGALTPTSVSGSMITWNVADFGLIDPAHDFNIMVQVDVAATIFDNLCVNLDVFPVSGDNDASNNSLYVCFPVRNSFDPNEKYMSPSGNVSSTQEWFDFTIYFQNTGNAPAEDIYILDTLDQNFDASTFTFLSSSHEAVTQLLPGNVLRFNFPDINLIDSVANEPASHGYVQFKVRRKDGLPFNTTLTNTAYIYFDFNPAIVTNQTSATLILIIGMDETTVPPFEIYPNPGRDEFTVYCPQFTVDKKIVLNVYNILGEVIENLQLKTPNSKLEITNWSPGIYFVEITFDGRKEVRKLVIE